MAWNSHYGPWAPSPVGGDFEYQHNSGNGIVTATYTITFQITWVGSQNTGGAFAAKPTATTSTFAVAEEQTVVVS